MEDAHINKLKRIISGLGERRGYAGDGEADAVALHALELGDARRLRDVHAEGRRGRGDECNNAKVK